jgi:hypothetical protein
MKRSLLVIGITVAITLAIIFSIRVSPDAIAVVIGVVLGVAASIPTPLLFVYFLTRQQHKLDKTPPQMPPQPPVFVINAADKTHTQPPPALPPPYPHPDNGRKWTVIGDSETDL